MVFPVAQYDWASPYWQRPISIHIVRRTGATKAGHPLLHYAWYDEDSGGGIAWGVLASPNLQSLLGVLKRQHVEDPIHYHRHLIGATGQGASALRGRPSDPLPLSELISLYTDDDIRVWLLANPSKDPLDLLVLESREDQGEGRDATPAPASGGHPFFDRKAWDEWGQSDDIGAGDDDDADHESLNDGSGSQDKDNVDHSHHDDDRVPPGQVHTPDRRGRDMIQGDEVSFLLFSFNILSNHLSRSTTGTTVDRRVGTPPGGIILPSEIHQADVPGIHDTGIQTLGHLRRSRLES